MRDGLYWRLKASKPKFVVKKDAKEVIFTMVSAMCDNRSLIKLKKNSDGEFRVRASTGDIGYAMSNYQLEYDVHDIEWAADEQSWDEVVSALNSGTAQIYSVRSR
jgi:hypothetical protein